MVSSNHLWGQKPTGKAVVTTAPAQIIIEVEDVSPATAALAEVPYNVAVESLLMNPPASLPVESQIWEFHAATVQPTKPVEACSRYRGQLVAGVNYHPVLAAIHSAFDDHRPLVLSPDILWLLVAQGIANHVNANAAELRARLVEHPGKATIDIRRDDFIKGSAENRWPEVFDSFTDQICEHIGRATHELLLPAFSTTGEAEKAAAQVVLLEAMQSYFSYQFHSFCGIPYIVLEGTVDDWEQLAERVRYLDSLGLKWWTRVLAPILDEFITAAQGKANVPFWQSIYKRASGSGSGGPFTTGWIAAFFPYLKDEQTERATRQNPWLAHGRKTLREFLYPPAKIDPHRAQYGPTTEAFPSGLARAPFRWHYLDHTYDMEFFGGFVGIWQEALTLRLRPEIGWAIREAGPA